MTSNSTLTQVSARNPRTGSTRRTRRSRALLAGVMAAAAGALIVGGSSAAMADAQGCASNTCMYVAGNSDGGAGTTVHFEAWPTNTQINGTFTVLGPGGDVVAQSADQSWSPGKGNGYCTVDLTDPTSGKYCIQGWDDNAGDQGTACETVSDN